MYLTKEQIASFIAKIGQPEASVFLNGFFNSYRSHLDSSDVKDLYDADYRKNLEAHPVAHLIDGKYVIHIYNQYVYDYLLTRPRTSSVLDTGCGNGDFVLALASQGYCAVGVDFSEPFIQNARKSAAENKLDAKFLCADVCDLPDGDQFDYVTLNDVTEHLSDRELNRLLTKIAKLVRPGGELIIHTPNGLSLLHNVDSSLLQQAYKSYLRLRNRAQEFERSVEQLYYEQTHINIKSGKQIAALLQGHGFSTSILYDEQPATLTGRLLGPIRAANMLAIARRNEGQNT